jgi:hypothetical protein
MFEQRIVGSWSRAVAWLKARPDVRKVISRYEVSHYRKIAALPETWGRALDELGAPYYLVRWVAGPGRAHPVLREQRYRAAAAALRSPEGFSKKDFAPLRAAHPKVQRRPPRHSVAAVVRACSPA